MLPAGSPMKCMSPSDVYMLLKSSDFIQHDLDPSHVFEGCEATEDDLPHYELELVLRKWYPVDRSRELRCFVRRETLLGMFTSHFLRSHADTWVYARYLATRSQLLRFLERA
jgi:hypothetical protein